MSLYVHHFALLITLLFSWCLQSQHSKIEAHLFPFIGPEEKSSELGHFYQQIFKTLVSVNNNRASQESIDELVMLAKQRYCLSYVTV